MEPEAEQGRDLTPRRSGENVFWICGLTRLGSVFFFPFSLSVSAVKTTGGGGMEEGGGGGGADRQTAEVCHC